MMDPIRAVHNHMKFTTEEAIECDDDPPDFKPFNLPERHNDIAKAIRILGVDDFIVGIPVDRLIAREKLVGRAEPRSRSKTTVWWSTSKDTLLLVHIKP